MSTMSRRAREEGKQAILFAAYLAMGPMRSLAKLRELVVAAGGRIALNTLDKYSVKYQWQRRVLEQQSVEQERIEKDYGRQRDQMDQRDAALGSGLIGLAFGGVRNLTEQMRTLRDLKVKRGESDPALTLNLAPSEIVNLARAGTFIERLARGEATSRTEVWVNVAGTVVREFVLIFMGVNEISDPEQRRDEFLRRADEMTNRYYNEATRRQLARGNGNGIDNGNNRG